MNVSLTPQLESLVQSKVSSGLYNNASEVIREALRLLFEKDELKKLRKELLLKELDIGIGQADRGEFSDETVESIAESILREKGLK